MNIVALESCVDAMDKNLLLREEKNFNGRMEAIDFIEVRVLDLLDAALQQMPRANEIMLLKHQAEKLKYDLEQLNLELFRTIRESLRVRNNPHEHFRNLVDDYICVESNRDEQKEVIGYDNLDAFVNSLLSSLIIPEPIKDLEPGMVYYQKTPARIIFGLVEQYQFSSEDVFFDLGSGLGQVAMLVNLLSGASAVGVEFEPAFCEYARTCASLFNLSNVNFINADARSVNYAEGTVFFMYTPFEGKVLQEVLTMLRQVSQSKKISVFTYGPCSLTVAKEDWLDFLGSDINKIYALNEFRSC